MILFGHLGITLFAGRTADKYIIGRKISKPEIDYRILFLGSILPDIIDKTIIYFSSDETLKSGRIIGHTLLFLAVFLLAGVILFNIKKEIGILVLSFGVFMHLILDSMWNYADILFWPFWGLPFIKEKMSFVEFFNQAIRVLMKDNPEISFTSIKDRLLSNPIYAIAEAVGLLVIVIFISQLVKFRQAKKFLKTGRFDFKK